MAAVRRAKASEKQVRTEPSSAPEILGNEPCSVVVSFSYALKAVRMKKSEKKDKMTELFEPPRWSGGPKLCVAENLPAFETKQAMEEYIANQCPSCHILDKWKCEACGMWHMDGTAPDPAGASSGTGRHRNYQRRRLKFNERKPGGPLYVSAADDRAEDKRIQREMKKDAGI